MPKPAPSAVFADMQELLAAQDWSPVELAAILTLTDEQAMTLNGPQLGAILSARTAKTAAARADAVARILAL